MTKCIAIDTSTRRFCLGAKNGSDYFDMTIDGSTDHAKEIFSNIEKIMSSAEIKKKQLDCFIIGVGPGRFSGLRVSISAIKTMSYVLKIPIVPVSSLEIMARYALKDKNIKKVIILEDAGKGNLYIGSYESKDHKILQLSKDYICHIDDLDLTDMEATFLGSGLVRYSDIKIKGKSVLIQPAELYLNSKTLIESGLEQFILGNTIECMKIKPNYLYEEVAN